MDGWLNWSMSLICWSSGRIHGSFVPQYHQVSYGIISSSEFMMELRRPGTEGDWW